MDDLISRKAVIEALKDMYHAAEKWLAEASDDVIMARAESCMASLVEMKQRIEKLPPAQRKGKWMKQNPMVDIEECSECGYNIIDEEFETPYCPWCGAEMRGDKDD